MRPENDRPKKRSQKREETTKHIVNTMPLKRTTLHHPREKESAVATSGQPLYPVRQTYKRFPTPNSNTERAQPNPNPNPYRGLHHVSCHLCGIPLSIRHGPEPFHNPAGPLFFLPEYKAEPASPHRRHYRNFVGVGLPQRQQQRRHQWREGMALATTAAAAR